MNEPEPRDGRPRENVDHRGTGERRDHDASLPGVAIPGGRNAGGADAPEDDAERFAGAEEDKPEGEPDNEGRATEGVRDVDI